MVGDIFDRLPAKAPGKHNMLPQRRGKLCGEREFPYLKNTVLEGWDRNLWNRCRNQFKRGIKTRIARGAGWMCGRRKV